MTWAHCLRVVWRGDPVVGQWIVHVLRAHLVQGRIPDGVLFREHVCQELWKERTLMILAVDHLKKKQPQKTSCSLCRPHCQSQRPFLSMWRRGFRLKSCLSMQAFSTDTGNTTDYIGKHYLQKQVCIFSPLVCKKETHDEHGVEWWENVCVPHLGGNMAVPLLSGGLSGS